MLITALAAAWLAQAAPAAGPIPAGPQDPPAVPLPRRALPADTKFVLHFDAQAFLRSAWWEAARSQSDVLAALDGSEELRALREQFGVDPLRDLLSITVLGGDDRGGDAAVLVRTTDVADGALATLRKLPVHSALQHRGLEVERWGPQDESETLYSASFATPNGDRVAILGRAPEHVTRVVLAADGVAPRLADSQRPAVDAEPSAGTVLYLELALPFERLLEDTPAAIAGQYAQRLTVELGERDGRAFFEARVRTKDRGDARKLADLISGARALAGNLGLIEQLPLPLQDLYDGLIAEVRDGEVRLGLALPRKDLLYLARELQGL